MKTERAPARILSAFPLLLCLAVLVLFSLSGCGDTPHVPISGTTEQGTPSAGEITDTFSYPSGAEPTDTFSEPAEGGDSAWETTEPQPSKDLLITEGGESDEVGNLFEIRNGFRSSLFAILLIIAALWIADDIRFKCLVRRKFNDRKKNESRTSKGVRDSRNAELSRKELEQEKRLETLEAKVEKLEEAEKRRNQDAPDDSLRLDDGKQSAISNGIWLSPQNPEELESKNYENPDVRLVTDPLGNLEIIKTDSFDGSTLIIPVLNEKTSDNPPGGVISRKSLCYSVIRSCFRVSNFPPDGLDRVNITISKPAKLQWNDGYYSVEDKGTIIAK